MRVKKTSNYLTCLRGCGTRQWTQVNGLNNFLLKVIIQLIGVSISSRIGSIKGLNLVGSFYLHGPVIVGSTKQTFYDRALCLFMIHQASNSKWSFKLHIHISSCTGVFLYVISEYFWNILNFFKKINLLFLSFQIVLMS